MGILGTFLQTAGQGMLESAAMRSQGMGVATKGKKRSMKKGASDDDPMSCGPCAGMAKVDQTRARLGYSVT